jgi:hypothetical protein
MPTVLTGVSNYPNNAELGVVVPSLRSPFQELRNAVDLIVVPTTVKSQELVQEAVEPSGLSRQIYVARFNPG